MAATLPVTACYWPEYHCKVRKESEHKFTRQGISKNKFAVNNTICEGSESACICIHTYLFKTITSEVILCCYFIREVCTIQSRLKPHLLLSCLETEAMIFSSFSIWAVPVLSLQYGKCIGLYKRTIKTPSGRVSSRIKSLGGNFWEWFADHTPYPYYMLVHHNRFSYILHIIDS